MTPPAPPPKPLTAADKGWTAKVDEGIESLIRAGWLLVSFPVAVPLCFLQPRRSATLALADARRAGRLLTPLFALGLAVLLVPHLLQAMMLALDAPLARATLEQELQTRAGRLASDMLTRVAPLLVVAWLAAQGVARLMTRLAGHARDEAFNAALYLMAATACVVPLMVLAIFGAMARPGRSGADVSAWLPWLFAGLAMLMALSPLAAIAHAAADAWRHAAGATPSRRRARALAAALCALALVLLVPAAAAWTRAGEDLRPYRWLAHWLLPPDPSYADADPHVQVQAQACRLDAQELRCWVVLKGLRGKDLQYTDLTQPLLQRQQVGAYRPGGDGVRPTQVLAQAGVALQTVPDLAAGAWLTLRPGTTTALTLRLPRQAFCDALRQVDVPAGQRHNLRLTATARAHLGGPPGHDPATLPATRLVLLPTLGSDAAAIRAGCAGRP